MNSREYNDRMTQIARLNTPMLNKLFPEIQELLLYEASFGYPANHATITETESHEACKFHKCLMPILSMTTFDTIMSSKEIVILIR